MCCSSNNILFPQFFSPKQQLAGVHSTGMVIQSPSDLVHRVLFALLQFLIQLVFSRSGTIAFSGNNASCGNWFGFVPIILYCFVHRTMYVSKIPYCLGFHFVFLFSFILLSLFLLLAFSFFCSSDWFAYCLLE